HVQIASGDTVFPYRPMPSGLDDILTTIEESYPSRSIVATIYRQAEGLSTRHGLVRDMPDSVLEQLVDQGSTQDAVRFKQMSRRVIETKKIIEGQHELEIEVLPAQTIH